MMFIGFGILAASLSFLFYRHGLPTPSSLLNFWRRNIRRGSTKVKQKPALADQNAGDRSISQGYVGAESGHVRNIPDSPRPMQEEWSAGIQNANPGIPTFTLNGDDGDDDDDGKKSTVDDELNHHRNGEIPENMKYSGTLFVNPPPPLKRSKEHSTTRPMPSPPRPQETSKPQLFNYNNSMLPPPRPSNTLRPLPKGLPSSASILRVPPNSSRSLLLSHSGATLSASNLPPSSRPSRKVLLAAGHSPLDWASLTRHPPSATFFRGAQLPPYLIRVPPSLLKQHNGRKGKDAWGVFRSKVYNLTPYLKFHPGGEGELMRAAGKDKDGEILFAEVHPWVSWESILGECLVGILVSERDAVSVGCLEDMD